MEELGAQKERILLKLKGYIYPQLRQQPFFGKNIKKLRDYKPETWRYRVGDFRFFYEIDERKRVVFMLTADRRGSAS